MLPVPSAIEPLFLQFSLVFTDATCARWNFLLGACVLTQGRRTASNLLRTLPGLTSGDPSSHHRVFSHRVWSMWGLGRALAHFIVRRWVPEGPIHLVGDDTVCGHKGAKVYGKGRHRDPVRSTHSFMAFRHGHKWVALCMLVKFPFAERPWALPVLIALYRTRQWNQQHGKRHKTPVALMRQMLLVLIRWFPKRKFVFAGDGGFSPHELAALAQRFRKQLTMAGKFHPDANLNAAPPARAKGQRGRRRKKGKKLPSPKSVVRRTQRRQRLKVSWYGGQQRNVAVVTGEGWWYKSGQGLVQVRWVFVDDLDGTHREEYFFTTDVSMGAKDIIETFTGRWSIEVTFEEGRAYLGLETTRGRKEETILREEPCLMGLFSVIALIYAEVPVRFQKAGRIVWEGKETTTFSDAITAVRRYFWQKWIFERYDQDVPLSKLPRTFRAILLYNLAPAS